jgi:hypothetical protein
METNKTELTPQEMTVGVHAVMQDELGTIFIQSAKTRMELGKLLSTMPGLRVVSVIKGKKLTVHEKKSFSFA